MDQVMDKLNYVKQVSPFPNLLTCGQQIKVVSQFSLTERLFLKVERDKGIVKWRVLQEFHHALNPWGFWPKTKPNNILRISLFYFYTIIAFLDPQAK
jgi:hypothetical protein